MPLFKKKGLGVFCKTRNPLQFMVGPVGFEPTTY